MPRGCRRYVDGPDLRVYAFENGLNRKGSHDRVTGVRDVKGLSPGVEQLARGDLIVELNRRPTPDLLAYRRALQGLKAGEPAWLLVHRPRPRGLFLAKVEVERE